MAGDSPLPPGRYQVELLENGKALLPPLLFSIGLPAAEEGRAPDTPEIESDGFAAPSLAGFELQATHRTDASPAIAGSETTVEILAAPNGDRVYRLVTNGIPWGVGWLPQGNPIKGYVLRDPSCSGVFRERWAADATFGAPDCAVGSDEPKSPDLVPWGDRGWRREAVDAYANPDHGLRIVVPAGWTIENSDEFNERFLWVMRKPGPDGQSRMTLAIGHRRDLASGSGGAWFEGELEALRASTVNLGQGPRPMFEIDSFGETDRPGVYEVWQTLATDGSRIHQFYFVRDGIGYVITRRAAADVTDDEIAELEALRGSLGLP